MLLIFFNTVMFLLTILALKKIISTLFTQRMWNHRSQVSHPKKSFATPIVFTASLTLPILLLILFYFFFFCGWFFWWYIQPISLSTTCSNSASSFSMPASCSDSTALFFLLFFFCFPLLTLIFPFLFGFFFLPFFRNFFIMYLNVLVTC